MCTHTFLHAVYTILFYATVFICVYRLMWISLRMELLLPTKQGLLYWPRGHQRSLYTSAKQAVALPQLPEDFYRVFQLQFGEQRQGVLRFEAVRMGSTVFATHVVMVTMITMQGIVLHIVRIACSLTYST